MGEEWNNDFNSERATEVKNNAFLCSQFTSINCEVLAPWKVSYVFVHHLGIRGNIW